MRQFIALLIDGYRELNARKLFWITLILSAIVIVAAGVFGIKGTTITFAGLRFADTSPMDPLVWYSWGYGKVFIGIWLDWAAIVLALVSTAGLYPDLISSGSIDLYLSKPISRPRLFIFKYVSGLLFVSLQVAVFALASFLLFGIRAHSWKPGLFLAIPIVVCMFSYLFAFCVLFGVWTRSTIAAILLTILLWFGMWAVQYADSQLQQVDLLFKMQVDHSRQSLASIDAQIAGEKPADVQLPSHGTLVSHRDEAASELTQAEKIYARMSLIHKIAHGIKTVVPKTGETNDLLDRWLLSDADADDITAAMSGGRQSRRHQGEGGAPGGPDQDVTMSAVESQEIQRHTSLWYVIGTSLLCEAVVVGFAGWIFCRRDY